MDLLQRNDAGRQLTEAPAWLETLICIFVWIDWEWIEGLALGMGTVALVTLALLGTFGPRIFLAFPQLFR